GRARCASPSELRPPGSGRRLEPLAQLVDLGDQVVDALDGVLAALVQLAQPLLTLGQASAQRLVLGAQRVVALDQQHDRLLQARDLVCRLRGGVRTGGVLREIRNGLPPETIRGYPGAAKGVKLRRRSFGTGVAIRPSDTSRRRAPPRVPPTAPT